MLSHLICHAIAAPMVTIDVDVQIVATLIPRCSNMNLIAYAKNRLLATMITAAWVSVER